MSEHSHGPSVNCVNNLLAMRLILCGNPSQSHNGTMTLSVVFINNSLAKIPNPMLEVLQNVPRCRLLVIFSKHCACQFFLCAQSYSGTVIIRVGSHAGIIT